MLIDEVRIEVEAGRGGNGFVSFRREKYVPKGGPDGGDGGSGGNVYLEVSRQVHGLEEFGRKHHFQAEPGEDGSRQQKHGKNGKDIVLFVPPGTIVREERLNHPPRFVADLKEIGQRILLAKGGNGGWGNQHFATSIKQAPTYAKDGLPGETKKIHLEWQLIADVGLVGLPNAGKSTFLSVVSAAKPKIASYPFTTLQPELGIARVHGQTFVLADIPGLIAGASEGRGLGDKFLRHIRRTAVLLHLVSVEQDVEMAYETIINELRAFDPRLLDRPSVIALSKADLCPPAEVKEKKLTLERHAGQAVFIISAATHLGVDALLSTLAEQLQSSNSDDPIDKAG